MKRLTITIFALSIAILSKSQIVYVTDAVKYSQNFPSITARSMSMGGAFTSLGGDFSSAYLNPAGLGLYRSSEFSITPGLGYSAIKSQYYSSQIYRDNKYQFMFGNFGYVGNYTSGRENGLVSASYAVGYSRLKNLNSNIYISGINEYNSLSDYFIDYANGTYPEDLDPFYERLAFDTYIIDTLSGTVDQYFPNVPLPIQQRKTINARGGNGEWSFALGLNISNVFYAGLGMGVQQLRYNHTIVHSEFDEGDLNDFSNFSFTEDLDVRGTGFNFKVGMMVRLMKILRIGGSLHLPTFYKINEKYYNTLHAEYDYPLPEFGNETVHDAKPTDTEGYEIPAGVFDYRLNTPLKIMGGASVQIGTFAIIAADVEFIDYGSMRLRAIDNYTDFEEANNEIENIYKSVVNLRLGGEFRLGNFSVRAGGGYYPSPFISGEINQNANYSELTTGIGYRDKNIFIDLGFSGLLHGEKYNLYWDNTADLDQFQYRMLLSFGIRL